MDIGSEYFLNIWICFKKTHIKLFGNKYFSTSKNFSSYLIKKVWRDPFVKFKSEPAIVKCTARWHLKDRLLLRNARLHPACHHRIIFVAPE